MKTKFKKARPSNKLGVNTYLCYDYKSTNYNYDNYPKPQHSSKDYNISPSGKTKILCYIYNRKYHKAFQCWIKRWKHFCPRIKIYSKDQLNFFALGYDIVSHKSNFLVDCGATKHIITDKSKFINFDQNFEPRNHFVELVNESLVNNIVLKRGDVFIFSCNSNGHMLYISQLLNKIYFQYKPQQKMVCI